MTNENTAVEINVIENDSDPDGSIVLSSIAINSDVTNGSTTINSNGTISYTPGAGFNGGSDSLTYTVKDNDGASSNSADVTITVNAIIGSDKSIKSTSQNGTPVAAVTEQPTPGDTGSGDGNHVILAINDLGMHCG